MGRSVILFIAAALLVFNSCAGARQGAAPSAPANDLRDEEPTAALADTNRRIDDLENRLSLLLEKVSTNAVTLEGLNKQVSTPGAPQDLRVIRLKKGSSDAREARPVAETPEGLYSLGQDMLIDGRHDRARQVLARIVDEYPDHGLADNALYWMGESYYTEKNYRQALKMFKAVVKGYPGQNKVPEALLKVGYTYMELGDVESGTDALDRLIREHPGTGAAQKARTRLMEISN